MKRRLYGLMNVLLGLALAATAASLAVTGNNRISVTSTATTVTLSAPASALTLVNDTASVNELYAQVFSCGETVAAATTSSPIRLEPGEYVNLTHGYTEPGTAYCGLSVIAATNETATARYWVK